ncbi:MAG: rubrerythrin family protein [Clostridia bacterium]|nr:rubrerythrin family protein [Clostridia bacterium]
MTFDQSQTRENLMRAFAGECMARQRYDYAAQAADKEKLYAVGRLFRFTADQEREHAELFYTRLSPAPGLVTIRADYPAQPDARALALLNAAVENEMSENASIYPRFAAVADHEGFPDVARLFERVAAIEKTHGDRFARYAQWLEGGLLFHSEEETAWVCLNCGHVLTGTDAPLLCPVCRHAQGYFVRSSGVL